MKKYTAVGAVLVWMLASVAYAHAPVLTINPIPDMTYATFPQTYNVTGTAVHNPVSSVKALTLRVNGAVVSSSTDPFALVIGTTSPFSLPWNITAPGTYTLTVTARHGTTGQTGTSTDEVVEVILEEVIVSCIAAPAHAADYMKSELGIKPNSEKFKMVIRVVAHEVGEGGVLWAKDSCESTYRANVENFVDELLWEIR